MFPFPIRQSLFYSWHADAIDWARWQAQLAPRAFRCDDSVHLFGCANDGIYGARLDAQRAADAGLFVDEGDRFGFGFCVAAKGFVFHAEQVSQFMDPIIAARWAQIDVRLAFGDGFSVRFATWIAALAALRLGQDCVDLLNKRIAFDLEANG